MQKINLKNTTKDKLYAMLVETEEVRNKLQIELSEVDEDRSVTRRAFDTIKAENARLCDEIGASERKISELEGKIKVLLCERDRARTLAESYKRGLDWCIEHPWKNLGKSWKEGRNG